MHHARMATSNPLDLDLDLDSLRAARREARAEGFRFRFAGQIIALVPELPLDVFGPLLPHLPTVMRMLAPAMEAGAKGDGGKRGADDIDLGKMVGELARNPLLPSQVIEGALEGARRLFADGAWDLFLAGRPTLPDVQALAPAVMAYYGVSLGEALRSAGSSAPDGATSRQTSDAGTSSTPGKRSGNPAKRASSESAT